MKRRSRLGALSPRWAPLFALLLLTGIGAGLFSAFALRAEAAKQAIEQQLQELTGHPVSIDGEAQLKLLPRARLALSTIRIGSEDGSGAGMRIDGMQVDLDFWQALLGRAEAVDLVLVRPELLPPAAAADRVAAAQTVSFVPPGGSPAPDAEALARLLSAVLARLDALGSLTIRDGNFWLAPQGDDLRITNVNVAMSWTGAERAAQITGSFVWDGQLCEVDLSLEAPGALLAGQASQMSLSLSAPLLEASFEGQGSFRTDLALQGKTSLRMPSLARAVTWLAGAGAEVPALGPFALEAELATEAGKFSFSDATVQLGDSRGVGALDLAFPPRAVPVIGGTIAFERLDLQALANAIAPYPDDPLDLRRPFATGFLGEIALDLRLSAATASFGELAVTELAATARIKDEALSFEIGDAQLLGGQGQAALGIDAGGTVSRFFGSVSLQGVEMQDLLLASQVRSVEISGRSDVDAEFSGPATHWADVLRQGQSRLDVATGEGVLRGFDFSAFAGQGAQFIGLGRSDTSMPFESLAATLSSRGSRIAVDSLSMVADTGRMNASGVLSAGSGMVDIAGSFLPTPPGVILSAQAPTEEGIGFRLSGIWPNPTVITGAPALPF